MISRASSYILEEQQEQHFTPTYLPSNILNEFDALQMFREDHDASNCSDLWREGTLVYGRSAARINRASSYEIPEMVE